MNDLSPYRHTIDLRSFLTTECSIIHDYMLDPAHAWDPLHYDLVNELILKNIARWATGITTTIIEQGVLNELRTARSHEHVKGDASSESVLHGCIKRVGLFPQQDAAVIHVEQLGCEYIVAAAVHGALLPFRAQFLSEGRLIHFANLHFSNDVLIPNQFCLIELRRSQSDIEFVLNATRSTSLKQLSQSPEALLLRIEGRTRSGITVSQGANDSAELVLEPDQMGLINLLRFSDIVVLFRPEVREFNPGILSLCYGPNTVMFRVPATLTAADPLSQVSQHHKALSQDGLRYRNSAACRSVVGTVERVEHMVDSVGWVSSTLHLCEPRGHSVKIAVPIVDCAREMQMELGRLRRGHFVHIFGLIERSTNVLYLTSETALYNPSSMYGIIASDIVLPGELERIEQFTTFVARAVVLSVECYLREVHRLCGAVVSPGEACGVCGAGTRGSCAEELVLVMAIDDGSCDAVTVAATGGKFPFWSGSAEKWKKADDARKREMLGELIGKEFIFVLSRGCSAEFGEMGDSDLWRVDMCGSPVGEAEREAQRIQQFHVELDREAAANEPDD
jgi:hypothetical protein